MTELQLGLIGLGAAAVAGVFGYNVWQDRKARKLADKVMRSRHADVLLGAEAPAVVPAVPPAAAAAGPEQRLEPRLNEVQAGAVAVDVPTDGEAVKVRVEPLEDADEVAEIPAERTEEGNRREAPSER
jgi:hypothetical protein